MCRPIHVPHTYIYIYIHSNVLTRDYSNNITSLGSHLRLYMIHTYFHIFTILGLNLYETLGLGAGDTMNKSHLQNNLHFSSVCTK